MCNNKLGILVTNPSLRSQSLSDLSSTSVTRSFPLLSLSLSLSVPEFLDPLLPPPPRRDPILRILPQATQAIRHHHHPVGNHNLRNISIHPFTSIFISPRHRHLPSSSSLESSTLLSRLPLVRRESISGLTLATVVAIVVSSRRPLCWNPSRLLPPTSSTTDFHPYGTRPTRASTPLYITNLSHSLVFKPSSSFINFLPRQAKELPFSSPFRAIDQKCIVRRFGVVRIGIPPA